VVIVWLGLYPQPVLDTAQPALENLQMSVGLMAMQSK
jgi:NADH:ubiquinone oxidoreductase subunit 4 (subunit M)